MSITNHGSSRSDTAFTPFNPIQEDDHQPLATSLKPLSSATLTVRIIKSFEFRTQKALVLQDVDLERETVGGLMGRCREGRYCETVNKSLAFLPLMWLRLPFRWKSVMKEPAL